MATFTLRQPASATAQVADLAEGLSTSSAGAKMENSLEKLPEKSSEKSSEKILQYLKVEPTLSAKALAKKMGISSRAIEKQIDLLKKDGRLSRIGPAKGGSWKVIDITHERPPA